ncbi:MAG: flagellar export chaperone FliS [Dehalococcoidia bacterium]
MQAGYDTYQRMQAETATPGQLIALLYDAMLRGLARAESGLEQHDMEAAHAALIRGQDIVLELVASLDMDAAGAPGEIARQMAPLYEYMYRRLLDASLQKDVEAVREVRRLLLPVRDAWAAVVQQTAEHDATAGVDTPGDLRAGRGGRP